MKNNYIFIEQEKNKATLLSTHWQMDTTIVDEWIDIYIQGMKEGARWSNYDKALLVEHQLETIYRTSIAHADPTLSRYLLARLLFYSNNTLSFGEVSCRIDSAYIEPLIKKLIKEVKYSIDDFLLLVNDYLAPTWVYPQNDLSIKLIDIAQKNNFLTNQGPKKFAIFTTLLGVMSKKGYHHDIIGFKKLLKYIREDDKELIGYLKIYHVATSQPCFEMLNSLFNFPIHSSNSSADFTIKRLIIEIFDTARGANIPSLWELKALDLASRTSANRLKEWCNIIINEDKWIYDNDTCWKDEVVTRFRKAAIWMNALLTGI